MVPIGYRPIMWHLMRYYAHFGHKDFILCLGYRGDSIKEYFLNYKEWLSNDFVLSGGGADVELLSSDIDDWRITFVDTGTHSNIGERLRAVRPHLEGDEVFLANYSDGLSDVPLDRVVDFFHESGGIAIVRLGHAQPQLPCRGRRRRWRGQGDRGRHRRRRVDQRRVLRDEHPNLRLPRAGRGARPRAVPAADRHLGAHDLSPRRLLRAHGHVQGPAGARGPLHPGQPALGLWRSGPA